MKRYRTIKKICSYAHLKNVCKEVLSTWFDINNINYIFSRYRLLQDMSLLTMVASFLDDLCTVEAHAIDVTCADMILYLICRELCSSFHIVGDMSWPNSTILLVCVLVCVMSFMQEPSLCIVWLCS